MRIIDTTQTIQVTFKVKENTPPEMFEEIEKLAQKYNAQKVKLTHLEVKKDNAYVQYYTRKENQEYDLHLENVTRHLDEYPELEAVYQEYKNNQE